MGLSALIDNCSLTLTLPRALGTLSPWLRGSILVDGCPTAVTTTPSSGPGDVGRGRRAHARGRCHPRDASASSPGRCSSRAPGTYDFGWLDEVLDLLHEGGHRASTWPPPPPRPPPWLTRTAPGDPAGATTTAGALWPGRPAGVLPQLAHRPRAPAGPRRAARRALRRAPALVMWHVDNELGCHNAHCYCDVSAPPRSGAGCASATRDLDGLNDAWGTAFWSQRYSDWDEILPPRARADAGPTRPSSWTSAGSPPTSCVGSLRRRARRAARADPADPGHHELHGLPRLQERRLLRTGRASRPRLQRPLPDRSTDPARVHSRWRSRRPHPRPRRRRAVAAHGALDAARSTGSRATSRRCPARCGATASRTSPAAPTARSSSSGAPRGPAPRSSTRGCCRTPAPTRPSGARPASSARDLAAHRRGPGQQGRRLDGDRLRLGRLVGRGARLPPDQRPALLGRACATFTRALAPGHHRRHRASRPTT